MKLCKQCNEKKKDFPPKRLICRDCFNANEKTRRAKSRLELHECWGITATLHKLVKDSRCVVGYNTASTRIKRHNWLKRGKSMEDVLTTMPKEQFRDYPTDYYAEIKRVTALRWV